MQLRTLAATALLALLCRTAQPAVFQCTGGDGAILFTDGGCPPGYATSQVVPEPSAPSSRPEPGPDTGAPTRADPQKSQASEAEIAQLKAQAENARLRAELEQERLRAIDHKLDALLDTQQVYGAVGIVPFGFAPKPFPVCKGGTGQTPWVNCRPPPADLKRKIVPDNGRFCGIVGCTPSIDRRLNRDDAPGMVR